MALIVSTAVSTGPSERWVRYDGDTEVLLRSLDDNLYQIGLARARRQINKSDAQFKTGVVGVAEGEISEHSYQCKLLSQYIIKDWRGANDAQGRAVKYSPEAGEATLLANIDFFLFVIKEASGIASDTAKEQADTVGKSSPATDGSSPESA